MTNSDWEGIWVVKRAFRLDDVLRFSRDGVGTRSVAQSTVHTLAPMYSQRLWMPWRTIRLSEVLQVDLAGTSDEILTCGGLRQVDREPLTSE